MELEGPKEVNSPSDAAGAFRAKGVPTRRWSLEGIKGEWERVLEEERERGWS